MSGGTYPYVPTWPAPISQSTPTIDSLSAGVYAITILDANGCQYIEPVTLNDIAGPTISLLNYTDASCFGSSDGIVNTNVVGGTTPYSSICWNGTAPSTYSLCGSVGVIFLPGNVTYCETVVDAAGCVANFCQYINEPSEVISAVVNQSNTLCFSSCDGEATVLAGGGSGSQSDYTYDWTPTGQTTATATGLCAGPIICISEDLNGCASAATATITEPPLLIATVNVTDALCFGESTGTSTVTSSGGTPFIIYTPNSGSPGLPAGPVNVTLTDQNGCQATASNTINQPAQLTASIVSNDAFCSENTGTATMFDVAGGTASYSYSWIGSNVTNPIYSNLYPSSIPYMGVVTDANGCTLNLSVTVNDLPAPVISGIDVVNPTCFGDCDGEAMANVIAGGNSNFTYHWNDIAQQSASTALGLCDGNYSVTVTDANGCTDTYATQLIQPAELLVVGTPPSAQLCAGTCVTIFAAPSGGNLGYSILWDNLQPDTVWNHTVCPEPSTISTYSFTVTDSKECTASNSVLVNTGSELLVEMPDTVETCLGNPVLISATGFGGSDVADYQWVWSSSPADNCNGVITCEALVAPTDTTTYVATLNDGCSSPGTGTIVVIVNPIPTPAFGVLENEGCPPFEAYFNGNSSMDNSDILWDLNGDGITDYTDSNVPLGSGSNPIYTYDESGLYTVSISVVSQDQCTTTVSIADYMDIYPIPMAAFSLDPEITTLLNPVVSTNASETIGADSLYTWNFHDPFDVLSANGVYANHVYSDTGNYLISLDVVNIQGCHDYDTVEFAVQPAFALYAPNAFTPNEDDLNEGFKLSGVGIDETEFELYIYTRWGEQIFYTSNFQEAWDGSVKRTDKPAPNNTYVWKAFIKRYTSSDGKEPEEFIGTITIVR